MTVELGGLGIALLTLLTVVFNAGVNYQRIKTLEGRFDTVDKSIEYLRARLDKLINGRLDES